MPATAPTTISTLPAPPDPNDRSTYNSLAHPWSVAQQTMVTQINAAASNVYGNTQAAEAAAAAADLDAAAVAADKVAAAASATTATTQRGLADTAAATATTQAGIATTQRGLADTAASTATTQAATATTQAASASAITLGVASGHPATRPTLNLDFANSRAVDPRITFTRASAATRINARGLVEAVASGTPRIDHAPITLACKGLLVEEARTNLLLYSNNVSHSSWSKGPNTVFTVEGINPIDGVSDFYSIRSTGSAGNLFCQRGEAATTTGTYTMSAWVRVDDATLAASGNRLLSPIVGANASSFLTFAAAGLTAGVWKRVSFSFAANAGDSITFTFGFDFSTNTSIKLFFCLPQLEFGAFPTSYIPSTVTHTGRASTATFIGSNGLIQSAASGAARYSYNPLNLTAAPALLLEAAATNLLLRSEEFDNASWLKARATVTANAATSPDGTADAEKLIDDTTAANSHFIYQARTGSNETLTFTVYAKAAERSYIRLEMSNFSTASCGARFNLSNGTVAITDAPNVDYTAITSSIEGVGAGWYRCRITVSKAAVNTTNNAVLMLSTGTSETYTGDGTSGIFVWGAQLEQGSYPTSYIPTTSAQATRAVDTSTSAATTRAADVAVMTGVNFSSWYRQDEGTFAVDYRMEQLASSLYPSAWYADDGTSNNRFGHSVSAGTRQTTVDGFVSGVNQFYLGSATTQIDMKTALAYRANDFAVSNFGGTVATDTTGGVSTVSRLYVGSRMASAQLNGHIRSLRYYPARLTNAQLQTLTTA